MINGFLALICVNFTLASNSPFCEYAHAKASSNSPKPAHYRLLVVCVSVGEHDLGASVVSRTTSMKILAGNER